VKPPPFHYRKPDRPDEALALLARPGSVALAGGQDLVPLLNSRRIRPSTLVDITALEPLRGITADAEGVRIGALTRHRDVLDSPVVRRRLGLLHLAAGHIGHGPRRSSSAGSTRRHCGRASSSKRCGFRYRRTARTGPSPSTPAAGPSSSR
jgi:carbon-monoxide dehydrogenase medium subunit